MSVIQKIQDKYGKLMAIIIGLSLVVFVIMLAFENGGSLFRGDSTTIGKVNGKSIAVSEFQSIVDQQSQALQQKGMTSSEELNQQANETAWNNEVARILLAQEAEKLGLKVGKKEFNDLIYGTNPSPVLTQYFSDPQNGYNPQMIKQIKDQLLKANTDEAKQQRGQLESILDMASFQRMAEKYDALLTNSINYPKWMIEKENAQSSLLSKVSFVRQPYTSISDSAVKVSDDDIREYVNAHKSDFKQTESRSISYVAFNAQPTAADSTVARQNILTLKPAFDSARNMKDYLVSQGVNTYYDGYISANRIQVPMKDSIIKAGVGNVYGPYIDGTTYSLAKIVAARAIPDTVKVRHILIATIQQDPQTGQSQQIRDTASAKKLADSLALAIRNGANFDSLVVKFSNDPGSVNNGGVYDNIPSGQMTPSFNDFIFGNPVGTKGIVKTEYGYHYVEILSQKGSAMGYKIAYINRPIEASQETDMIANNAATRFAGKATNAKSFNAEAEKLQKEKGIFKSIAEDIPPSGVSIQGVGASRAFVKSIYSADLGDVVQPERVGDHYVVGLVTEINKEGTMSATKARALVAPLLLNQKKAEIIKKKIGKVTTLEAAASVLKKPVEVADSLRFDGQASSQLGFEPKVLGAAFNKANLNKVVNEPIAGTQGVYVVRVDQLSSTPVAAANVEETRKARYLQAKQQSRFQSLQALKEAASIKDYRSKFY